MNIKSQIVETCARHAHEINRSYCAALGDMSQSAWEDAPAWQRESAIAGVRAVLSGAAKTPEEQHACWMAVKVADGWRYGPVKDAEAKTHPCMVPYHELPPEQRAKDHLFRAAVLGMARELASPMMQPTVVVHEPAAKLSEVAPA